MLHSELKLGKTLIDGSRYIFKIKETVDPPIYNLLSKNVFCHLRQTYFKCYVTRNLHFGALAHLILNSLAWQPEPQKRFQFNEILK